MGQITVPEQDEDLAYDEARQRAVDRLFDREHDLLVGAERRPTEPQWLLAVRGALFLLALILLCVRFE